MNWLRKHLLAILLGVLLVLATAGAAAALEGTRNFLPLVNTQGGDGLDEAGQRITVPDGFKITIYADGLEGKPRLAALGPDGWLYVALIDSGEVVRLPDRDHNGRADRVEVAASGLDGPNNVAWLGEDLYVAEMGRVTRLSDSDGDGVFETRQVVTSNIPGPTGHSSRTVHFGPDGKMYVSAGSSSNLGPETDPRRGAILRFNPDGSIPADNPFASDADARMQAVWAWGLRNSVDFLWTPGGQLWADHNGSDGLGDAAPPEELIIAVEKGQSHGWPYCYTPVLGLNVPAQDEVRDTRVELPDGFSCDQAVPAVLTVEAHSAPLGMTLGTGSWFPAEYQDDVFVALHGSWNTNNPGNYRDCKVQRVLVENGAVVGSETFANGWRAPGGLCGDNDTWGRPAGVAFGADGALYITDDKGKRVYRVVYTGK